MIRTVKKTKVSEHIIDEVRQMLIDGRLKEGDKLPNQISFAEQLGVSRLSLREALQTLSLKGIIEQSPKSGTIIIIGDPESWDTEIETPLFSNETATKEFVEARRIIEVATSFKIGSINEEELNKLKKILQKMRKALQYESLIEYNKLDIEFHLTLVKTSRNRYLIHMYKTLSNKLGFYMREASEHLPFLLQNTLLDHEEIVEYLETNKPEKAKESLVRHHEELESNLNKYYSTENAKK